MNPFGVLADPLERLDPVDIEFFKFTSLVPDAKVSIQTDPFTKAEYPTAISLIACSSKQQYFIAGTTKGFIYGSTKSLRTAFYNTNKGEVTTLDEKVSVSLSEKVRQIKLSATESSVFITTSANTLLIYHVDDIKRDKEQVKPAKTINLSNATLEIKPNPEVHPNLIALLYENHTIDMLDIETGAISCKFPLDNYTALCWSRKGKQIVCGNEEGSLIAYDISGVQKDTLDIPNEMKATADGESGNRFVSDVLWVDNNVFFAIYTLSDVDEDNVFPNDAYIIDRKINQSKQEGYTRLPEFTPIYTSEGRGNRFYIELVPRLGKEISNLIIVANAATNEISVVGEDEEGEWNIWMLPENGMATLPLSDESQDTYPLGLAVDFAADEKLPPFDASENDKPVEPFPVFYYINDEGQIGAYHCYNVEMARRGEAYTLPSAEASKPASGPATAATTTAAAAAATTSTSSPFGSAFGQPSSNTTSSSFKDLLSGKAASNTTTTNNTTAQSSFGFGAFGSALNSGNSGPSSFASLASAQTLPAAPSMGMKTTQPTTSTPAFGSTSSVGFGGQPTLGAAKPTTLFGGIKAEETNKEDATTAQQNTSTTKTTTTASPFGMSSTTPAFGSTSFGASTTKPTFGSTTSFGTATATTTPAFGTTSFGSSAAKPTSLFGSPKTTTSSSSSTSSPTIGCGFGTLPKNTASNTTTPTALGGGGGFGALAKNTVPGASNPTASSGFGSATGFGALAKNTVAGATTPTTTPAFGSATGFGALAKNTVAGATAPTTTPAFGSTSFGSLAKNTVPSATNPTTSPSFGSATGFGALAKNTVAGAKNPSAAPAFGSTTGFGAAAANVSDTKNNIEKPATTTSATASTKDTAATVASGFGSLAVSSSPTAAKTTTPSSGSGFGLFATSGTKTVVSEPSPKTTPITEKNATSKETATPAPTSNYSTKASTSTTPANASTSGTKEAVVSKPESTDKEGMAYQFEKAYFNTTAELKEDGKVFKSVSDQIEKAMRVLEPKTIDKLNSASEWNLNDITAFKKILDDLTNTMSQTEPQVKKMNEQLEVISVELEKLTDKRTNIEDMIDQELNSELIDLMDARELDSETRQSLTQLQAKSSSNAVLIEQLELKIYELLKRYKLYNEYMSNELSSYSLIRLIRDIERGLTSKKRDLDKVSEALQRLSLDNSKIKARHATHGYSCDFSDSEDDEEGQVSPSTVEYTKKYIRRTQFLDGLWDAMGKKKPIQASTAN